MPKREVILGGVLAVLLCGCQSEAESPAEEQADAELQETVKDSTAELANTAAKVPDAEQANEIIDEAVELTDAAEEAAEKTD